MIHRLTLLVILMLAVTAASAQQKPDISIAVEYVPMDVLVTENNKPVTNLTADDFEVLDNGVPQKIHEVKLQNQTPINAILVFDMSVSVEGKLLDRLKDAAVKLLNDLMDQDFAALITFNNAVVLSSGLTHDFAGIKQALGRVQLQGKSSLIDASYMGLVLAQSKPDPPLLIIFSDGQDTASWLTGEAVLKTAKRNDAVVYAVSVKRLPENAFLRDLTKLTGGRFIEIGSNTDLTDVFLGILQEFRQRYLLSFTPSGVSKSGWHDLEVRVKRRSVKIRVRSGYMRSDDYK